MSDADFWDLTPREWRAYLKVRADEQEQRMLEIGIIGSTIVNTMCTKKITVDQFLGRKKPTGDGSDYLEALKSIADNA